MLEQSELKEQIKAILQKEFPSETVDVSDGYAENIHVIVVSHRFTGLSETQKQDLLWGAIDRSNLDFKDKCKISLILPYSPSDLK